MSLSRPKFGFPAQKKAHHSEGTGLESTATSPTPVGDYNPDWAIVSTVQDEFGEAREKLYLVRETKGALDEDQLRGMEEMKIDCAERHFDAIGVDYGVVATAEDLRKQT